MDISTLSLADLKKLQTLLPAEIHRREKEEKAKTLKDLAALAAERGFTLEELLGAGVAAEKKERVPVAVKYRHPENGDLAWTGRGRQPKWLVEFLANGGSIDQLAV